MVPSGDIYEVISMYAYAYAYVHTRSRYRVEMQLEELRGDEEAIRQLEP